MASLRQAGQQASVSESVSVNDAGIFRLGMALSMQADEEMVERDLIERARNGERAAFDELMRKHQAKAMGLASRIINDHYMAEDVVQDAFIRAFLHLGTLMDASKFVPWLHRIVRNQALLKLRRGGPFGKERPFSSMSTGERETSSGSSNRNTESADWSNIDFILFRLQDAAAQERYRDNPEESLLRQDTLQSLRALFCALSPRERKICEAHFFGEISPSEIAKLLDTTTANVYNVLSRSRTKIRRERIRISLVEYVQRREALGLPRRNILPPPP